MPLAFDEIVDNLIQQYELASPDLVKVMRHLRGKVKVFCQGPYKNDKQFTCGRIKDSVSLREKIANRKPGKYNGLKDIPDLVGVRLVIFSDARVALVAEALKENLLDHKVINNELVPQFAAGDDANDRVTYTIDVIDVDHKPPSTPMEFQYRTSHLDVNFLIGQQQFRAEIQVRSLLMHAWAETAHNTIYKTTKSLNDSHRREAAMLSAALEGVALTISRLSDEIGNAPDKPAPMLQDVIRGEWGNINSKARNCHWIKKLIGESTVEFLALADAATVAVPGTVSSSTDLQRAVQILINNEAYFRMWNLMCNMLEQGKRLKLKDNFACAILFTLNSKYDRKSEQITFTLPGQFIKAVDDKELLKTHGFKYASGKWTYTCPAVDSDNDDLDDVDCIESGDARSEESPTDDNDDDNDDDDDDDDEGGDEGGESDAESETEFGADPESEDDPENGDDGTGVQTRSRKRLPGGTPAGSAPESKRCRKS